MSRRTGLGNRGQGIMKKITELLKTGPAKLAVAVLLVATAFAAGLLLRGGNATGDGKHTQAAVTAAPETAEIWTCSMHPQIKLPKPGKCPICSMDLIPVHGGKDDMDGLRELSVSENAARLMEIETAPVQRRFVTANVRMVGKIDYDETRVSYITAWVPGRLDRLFVDYTGVPVKKGDHMVSLYSPELLSAQEELLQAIAGAKSLERSDVAIVRDTTEATIVAAREKLRLWGLTPEQIAAIEQRGTAEDHITINAPVGGIVIHKNAQEGMYVQTGTRIYTIADLSRLWIILDAYESDLQWLKYGQRVTFTPESYPGETFTGTISFIHPVLNEATRTVKMRMNVTNENGRLKPGMFVRAVAKAGVAAGGRIMDPSLAGKWIGPMHPEVVKDEPGPCDICGMPLVRAESLGYVGAAPGADDKPLVIPASAALLTGKRAIVYVKVPGSGKPTYEGREIVLGPRAGDYYIVKRGLAAGERVVTRGAFMLDAELQIRAKPSMMTPGGGGGAGEHAHHGGGKPKPADQPTAPAGPTLPAVVKSQLHDVLAAANGTVNAASGEDIDRVRSAFRALQERVRAVEAGALSGYAAMLWKEYAMLLGNDGRVGMSVKTIREAAGLAAATREHADAVQAEFGLMHGQHAMTDVPAVDPAFRKQLGAVVAAYLAIQAALADDDYEAATTAARSAQAALGKVDMSLVKGDAHLGWMKIEGSLKTFLAGVADAGNIQTARAQFALLSEQLVAALTRFGVAEGKLYKVWCPMSFDNRGASWIQGGEAISNPYFGHRMPGCGEIRDVLQ